MCIYVSYNYNQGKTHATSFHALMNTTELSRRLSTWIVNENNNEFEYAFRAGYCPAGIPSSPESALHCGARTIFMTMGQFRLFVVGLDQKMLLRSCTLRLGWLGRYWFLPAAKRAGQWIIISLLQVSASTTFSLYFPKARFAHLGIRPLQHCMVIFHGYCRRRSIGSLPSCYTVGKFHEWCRCFHSPFSFAIATFFG